VVPERVLVEMIELVDVELVIVAPVIVEVAMYEANTVE
jgi:uncharacterized membrane protein YqhA